jgi:hypothetical protein
MEHSEMPQFQKGNAGKAKGTKDNRWAKVQFWFDELKKDWPLLTPNQRANLSVELMRMLTNKAKTLPSDPTDSVINASEAMDMLERIASKTQPESKDVK